MTARPRLLLAAATLAVGAVVAVPAQATPVTASYLVTLAPGTSAQPVLTLVRALGGRVGFVYSHALNGFSVTLPVPALGALRALPGVAGVEADQLVHVTATAKSQARPPSYGIDRIDQRALPLDGRYRYSGDGAGVTAYVIDTGLRYDHVDLRGRAAKGIDLVTKGGNASDTSCVGQGNDVAGHGMHVAGTLGGTQYGVAKRVRLVSVRVLDCTGSGPTSAVIAGIDWVVANHRPGVPAVANISLGGPSSEDLDNAVKRLVQDGVTVGVAAGNDGNVVNDLLGWSDACDYSPSKVPEVLTVAAVDSTDTRADYSDTGACVDLWAPGTDIVSDWFTSPTATNTLSGTSMATPHVVGTAAVYLSSHPRATPGQVMAALVGKATSGAVQGAPSNTDNRMLYQAW